MGHLSSPPHKAAMLYLGYPSSAPQQLLKLSWWVQPPGCRTRQRTRPPGFLFRKLGAGRGRSKQLRPGFLPWRTRAGRFCAPCPEQGRAPTLAGHEGTECPPALAQPGSGALCSGPAAVEGQLHAQDRAGRTQAGSCRPSLPSLQAL